MFVDPNHENFLGVQLMSRNIIILCIMLFCLTLSSIASAQSDRTEVNESNACRIVGCREWGLGAEGHYHKSGGRFYPPNDDSNTVLEASSPNEDTESEGPDENGFIDVDYPTFDVVVNGQMIMNYEVLYPVFVHKNITYFPMTWNYTRALAIESFWDNNTGLSIRRMNIEPESLSQNDPWVKSGLLYAKKPEFKVFVNDSWVDNSKEEYPILYMNGITYFPLTWKLAVEDLGLSLQFENNTLSIRKSK